MLKKMMVLVLVAVLGSLLSGCVVGVPMIIAAENNANTFSGVVEVGEVKMKAGANIALLKTSRLSSTVFEEDMVTPNTSPNPMSVKVYTAVTEEVKRSLGSAGNATSSTVIRLKTFHEQWSLGSGYWYYGRTTEKSTLSFWQQDGIRKLVNTHFILEQGSDTLLEVHGLWVSGRQGDEIAGAKQLAKAIAAEVLKKLNSPASRKASIAEAKKE